MLLINAIIIISIVENRSKFITKKGVIHSTLSQRQIYSGDVISKMRLNQLNVTRTDLEVQDVDIPSSAGF